MWDEQFAAFAPHHRVIRYDARGFGRTTSESGTFSDRQDIVDLLAHLGIARAAILGLSRGGHLAIDFTLEHPELVDALIAVAAGVSGYQNTPTAAEMQLFGRYRALWERRDIAELTEFEVRIWADGPGQPEGRAPAPVRDRVRQMVANNYATHQETLQSPPLEPPAIERLGEVRAPALVIVGDLDFSDTIAAMDALAMGLPNARQVVFPGVAHMVNMEQPERFNATVLEFLAS
jgi:3-oxoadipate enol-lactonase